MDRPALFAALLFFVPSSIHSQWALETSNTTSDLRGIHSIGNGIAWASGTNGTVLRTEDGGYVWQSCSIPPGAEHLDFRGIQAFDANTAIVMSSGKGDLSRLYKTTDGCHTWKLIFTNPDQDGFWDAIRSHDETTTVLGDPVAGRMTLFTMRSDAPDSICPRICYGEPDEKPTLQIVDPHPDSERAASNKMSGLPSRLEHNPNALDKEGFFAASNSSYIDLSQFSFAFAGGGPAAARALVYDCEDSQKRAIHCNWHVMMLPMAHAESAGAFSIASNQTTHKNVLEPHGVVLIAVGGDFLKPAASIGTASYTRDFGRHWHPAQTPPHGYRSSVAYDAATKTWITVGPNGTDISSDDGKSWRPLRPDPARHQAPGADLNWNAISLPFVVGPHGRIAKLNPDALKTK
jgi:photosystem II stability/assembly factor-like uncharacterized protein